MNIQEKQHLVIGLVRRILKKYKIPATKEKIEETLLSHPDFPSLLSVSEALLEWGLKSEALLGHVEELSKAELLGIVHMNDDRFLILTEIDKDFVGLIDWKNNYYCYTFREFQQAWTGVILKISPGIQTGEWNYKRNKRDEVFANTRQFSLFVVLPLMLFFILLTGIEEESVFSVYTGILATKFLGLFLTILLGLSHTGHENLLNKSCTTDPKSRCSLVINSPAGHILGIPIADIGLLYFSGGLIAIVFSQILGVMAPNIYLLGIVNSIILPFTLFSIFYQGFILHTFCWMCTSVQILLWVEFLLFNIFHNRYLDNLSLSSFIPLIFGFSTALIIWSSLRFVLSEFGKKKRLENELSRLKRGSSYIDLILNESPQFNRGQFSFDIVLGAKNAEIDVTLVIKPLCRYCKDSIEQLFRLIQFSENRIKGIVRFQFNLEQVNSTKSQKYRSYKFIIQALSLAQAGDQEKLILLFKGWFSGAYRFKGKKVELWLEEFTKPNQIQVQDAEVALKSQYAWSMKYLQATVPAILINHKLVPSHLELEDLKYYLLRKLDQ